MFCKSTTTNTASCVSYLSLSKVCSSIYFTLFFSFIGPGKGTNSSNGSGVGSGDSVDAEVVSWWQLRSESQYPIGTVVAVLGY